MPVVRIELARFARMVGASGSRVTERIPYLGLDIESSDKSSIRVEYSPNRPDFGTDYGIARALRGLLGKDVGLPRYKTAPSGVSVDVDPRLSSVRPFISCATTEGVSLDGEDLRQLLSLQEDLHNGMGRGRSKVAIGLHDMKPIDRKISYRAVPASFRFTPLGGVRQMTIGEILSETEQGRQFGPILAGSSLYPILSDSAGIVLSFPPVINGNATKVTTKTKSLFVDVTGTNQTAVDDVLAILATTLAEMGGKPGSTVVGHGRRKRTTPLLRTSEVALDLPLIREVTGLELTRQQAVACLEKSRLGVKGNRVVIPRYRLDILHRVDIAEEVALGYGIDKIATEYPPSGQPGEFNSFEQFLDSASDLMSASGMIELMTYELMDEDSLYARFQRSSSDKITLEHAKSLEHSVLRDSLIPSLISVLSGNVKEDYPQRVYEIGRVYNREKEGAGEAWHLGCLIAHTQSSFTEAKMYLDSFLKSATGLGAETSQSSHWAFAPGRTASVRLGGVELGTVGEVRPEAIDAFGLKVPVSGFEIDLSLMHKQPK